VREAVDDIDEEVARLNRIVNEVLDFARPIRSSCAPSDSTRSAASRRRGAGVGPGRVRRSRSRRRRHDRAAAAHRAL
jgi:hypothetical protein